MKENQITRPLEVIETEINFYKQQTATGIIEIGKRLIEAKSQLEHGQWGKWLEGKVDFKRETARKFMLVAEQFSNSQSLGNLNQTKIFALLDLPQDQREEFIETHNVESLTTRQLQEEIKKVKEEMKKQSDELLKQNEQKFKLEKEELEKKLLNTSDLERRLKQNQEEQQRLKNRISELVQQGTKTEIVTQEVDKPETLSLIKDLQNQLQEKTEYGQKIYNDMMEKTKLLNVAMGESTNWQLTSHCSEITLKMLNFIKDMAKYDYMAESFNEIPLATKKEYYRCIQSVKRWADNILTVIEKEQNIIEVE